MKKKGFFSIFDKYEKAAEASQRKMNKALGDKVKRRRFGGFLDGRSYRGGGGK